MCDQAVAHIIPLVESSSREVTPGSITSLSHCLAGCWSQDLATKAVSDKFAEFDSTNACYCFSQNVTSFTIIFTLSAKLWTVYLNILKRIKKTFHKNHLLPYESLSARNAHTSIQTLLKVEWFVLINYATREVNKIKLQYSSPRSCTEHPQASGAPF